MALSRDAITWLPIHLAQSLGYVQEEGLTLTVSDVAGLSKGAEALLGGSVDVAGGNLTMALQLNAEGRAVQSFVMLSTRPNFAIVAGPRSGIRTVADLKGRRVGISSPGSPTQLFLNYLLASHGLSPDDISTVSIGAAAASIAALEHDRVDAASLVGSAITTMQKRYPTLTFLADARRPEGAQALFGSPIFPSSSLLAEVRWLKENADTAHRFVRAITKAMAWMRAHPAEEVLAQIPEPLRMADPDTDVESIRDSQRALSEDGVVWADGPEVVRKVLAASNEKVRTVRDITFDVPAGRFISIVGPSGCGKSTVLNVIAGLLAPSAGTVEVFGSPLTGVNTRASYMFQGDALLPWKTVLANIRLGLTFRGQTGSDALDLARVWLERVGLSGFGDRYPSQLSGGMRKRVAMAQAWIVQPDLVLMDEPFAALDVHTRLRMESEVLGLWTGSRQTVMFVTHDLEEAIALSDEVLVLSAGPGSHLVGRYAVDLARPRDLIDIKMEPRFQELFRSIWSDLRQEVLKSYERPA